MPGWGPDFTVITPENSRMTQKACAMKENFSLFQITLVGIAAVGGLMAGTCAAIKRTLSDGEARLALIIGYAFTGLAFGAGGAALGIVIPALDVESFRGALLIGAASGGGGVIVMAAANIGSVITLKYFGLRVTIEPDDTERRRDQRRHTRRRDGDRGES